MSIENMGSRSEDVILAAIEGLRCELTNKAEVTKKEILEALNTKVGVIEEEVKFLKDENSSLKERITQQEQKIKALEKESKNKELIIHGLEENAHENLNQAIINLFRNVMKLNIKEEALDKVFRLGQNRDTSRPIRLILTTSRDRDLVLSNRKSLRGSNVYISENFPKEVLEVRKSLFPEMKKLRNEGKIAFIKYDKLVVKDKLAQKNKRLPSEEDEHNLVNRVTKQPKVGSARRRVSSVSSATGLKVQNIRDMFTASSSQTSELRLQNTKDLQPSSGSQTSKLLTDIDNQSVNRPSTKNYPRPNSTNLT